MPLTPQTFEDAVEQAVVSDPRYRPGAYYFVREALAVAARIFRGGSEDQHVTGQELLEGVRQHALGEFGPMAFYVLREWGMNQGLDVGHVVYNLINVGYFGKNDGDRLEDFAGGYRFDEAFLKPYEPRSKSSR